MLTYPTLQTLACLGVVIHHLYTYVVLSLFRSHDLKQENTNYKNI